jgi:hypothetical protein
MKYLFEPYAQAVTFYIYTTFSIFGVLLQFKKKDTKWPNS